MITGQSDPPSSSHSVDGVSGGGDTSDNDTDSVATMSTLRDASMSVSSDSRAAVQPGGSGRPSAGRNSVFEHNTVNDSDTDILRLAAHTVSFLSHTGTVSFSVFSVLRAPAASVRTHCPCWSIPRPLTRSMSSHQSSACGLATPTWSTKTNLASNY